MNDSSTSNDDSPLRWMVLNSTLWEAAQSITTHPDAPFPYTRLGFLNPMNSSSSYFYHQINATTVGEEMYDAASGLWSSQNITVEFS